MSLLWAVFSARSDLIEFWESRRDGDPRVDSLQRPHLRDGQFKENSSSLCGSINPPDGELNLNDVSLDLNNVSCNTEIIVDLHCWIHQSPTVHLWTGVHRFSNNSSEKQLSRKNDIRLYILYIHLKKMSNSIKVFLCLWNLWSDEKTFPMQKRTTKIRNYQKMKIEREELSETSRDERGKIETLLKK